MIVYHDPCEFVQACVSFPRFTSDSEKCAVARTLFYQIASPFNNNGYDIIRIAMAVKPIESLTVYGTTASYGQYTTAYDLLKCEKRHEVKLRVMLMCNGQSLAFGDTVDVSIKRTKRRLLIGLWEFPRLKRDYSNMKRII